MLTTIIQTFLMIVSAPSESEIYYDALPTEYSSVTELYDSIISEILGQISNAHVNDKVSAEQEKDRALLNRQNISNCLDQIKQLHDDFKAKYNYTEENLTNPNIVSLLDINTSDEDINIAFQQYFNYKITSLFDMIAILDELYQRSDIEVQRAEAELQAANDHCVFVEDHKLFVQSATIPDTVGEAKDLIAILEQKHALYLNIQETRSQEREEAKNKSESENTALQIDCASYITAIQEEEQDLDLDKSLVLTNVRDLYNSINPLITEYNALLATEIDYTTEIEEFELKKQNIPSCIDEFVNNPSNEFVNIATEIKNTFNDHLILFNNTLDNINGKISELKSHFNVLREGKTEKELIEVSQTIMDVRDARLLNERMEKVQKCINDFKAIIDTSLDEEISILLDTVFEPIMIETFLTPHKQNLDTNISSMLTDIQNKQTLVAQLLGEINSVNTLYTNVTELEFNVSGFENKLTTIEAKITELTNSGEDPKLLAILDIMVQLYNRSNLELKGLFIDIFHDITSDNYNNITTKLLNYMRHFKYYLLAYKDIVTDKQNNLQTWYNTINEIEISDTLIGCDLFNKLDEVNKTLNEATINTSINFLPSQQSIDVIKDFVSTTTINFSINISPLTVESEANRIIAPRSRILNVVSLTQNALSEHTSLGVSGIDPTLEDDANETRQEYDAGRSQHINAYVTNHIVLGMKNNLTRIENNLNAIPLSIDTKNVLRTMFLPINTVQFAKNIVVSNDDLSLDEKDEINNNLDNELNVNSINEIDTESVSQTYQNTRTRITDRESDYYNSLLDLLARQMTKVSTVRSHVNNQSPYLSVFYKALQDGIDIVVNLIRNPIQTEP